MFRISDEEMEALVADLDRDEDESFFRCVVRRQCQRCFATARQEFSCRRVVVPTSDHP